MINQHVDQLFHRHLSKLENWIKEIGATILSHVKLFVQSLKEQEKAVNDNTKLVERSITEEIKRN